MASIHKEISISARPDEVWDALADFDSPHTRLVAGFVVGTQVEPGARIVTFANGLVARELLVDRNDTDRRLVWSAVGGLLTHHNASAQVLPTGDGHCRVVWIADLLPDEMAPAIASMTDEGLVAMKRTLEG
jgi:carbon monoxide dehydrogenase subunit G